MATEYREERNKKIEKQIMRLLDNAPSYINDFYEHMHNGRREILTQLTYIQDVIDFIKYESSILFPDEEISLKDFPFTIIENLSLQDMNEYRSYLRGIKNVSNASIKKRFSAISAFYKFCNTYNYTTNNPMLNFEFPAVNKKRIIKLNASLSEKLLTGILANDKYLIQTETGDPFVAPIDETVRIKREKLVLRNYAICCLFLGSGLRVSELVGLDLDDINFTQHSLTVIAKGGDETSVYFGDEVATALKNYIYGIPLPTNLISKYKYNNPQYYEWCLLHRGDENFEINLKEAFPDLSDSEVKELNTLKYSILRQGRDALKPKKGNNAVFITTRGTRMSTRSVELMVKEMVQTYLPEYEDKKRFSPHKLRATCASRILTQTGDITLASTQLNHKGVAVTADFYAQLQKEIQKEKIRQLDITDW